MSMIVFMPRPVKDGMVKAGLAQDGRRATMGPAIVALLLAFPLAASAADVNVKVEPGVSIPLSAPQSEIYDVGGGQSLKVLFGLTPWLDIGPTASFLLLPAAVDQAESGVAWGLGGGLRVKGARDAERVISPWLDADLLYAPNGELHRPGFDAAVGLSVPIGEERSFWFGPFVRYLQVIQPVHEGYDSHDAKILTLGLTLEAGRGAEQAPAEVRTVTTEVVREVVREVSSCPDGDKDGIVDASDPCPTVFGAIEDLGCPKYQKVVVRRDKLELKEKLYFAWDEATIEPASYPVLDEVALALKDNPGFKVQVEGHTDSSGGNDHNQTLSEDRAQAVVAYLVAHGVAKDRLVSKGFSSSVPLDTNTTVAGRENNRRVEFVVSFILVNTGSAK